MINQDKDILTIEDTSRIHHCGWMIDISAESEADKGR